jgi:hypothetical protein
MSCTFCDGKSQYRDRRTGQYVCLAHSRLEVVAAAGSSKTLPLTIRPAATADYARIEQLSLHFWDETVVDCFDREYDLIACSALLACDGDEVVGLASYTLSNYDLPALALYQRNGFRITEVAPGNVAQHHGGELPGFAGIPVRDEIRLEFRLTR